MQRYIFRHLAVALIFVTAVLTVAIWLTQSMRFVKFILTKGLALGIFFELTALLLPSFLMLILPIAAFLAVLFVYNKMINDREIVVMRVAGVGQFGLARPALVLAGIVMVVGYAISLYLLPVSFRAFKDMQYAIRNDFSAVLLQEGVFNNVGKGVTIYVRARVGRDLHGILVQDNRKPAVPVTMMAQRGTLVSTELGPRVIMVEGNRQELNRKTGRLSLLYFKRYSFDVGWFSKKRKKGFLTAKERFIGQLLDPGDSEYARYYGKKLAAEGHGRLTAPFYALSFVVIALAVLLSGQFNKRGQAARLLTAVGITVAVQSAAIGIMNVAARIPEVIPLMYVSAAAPVIVGLYYLSRGPRRGKPYTGPLLAPGE